MPPSFQHWLKEAFSGTPFEKLTFQTENFLTVFYILFVNSDADSEYDGRHVFKKAISDACGVGKTGYNFF
jgi:hypothetical protein